MLCCAVLCCAVLCCAVLCCTVLYFTVQGQGGFGYIRTHFPQGTVTYTWCCKLRCLCNSCLLCREFLSQVHYAWADCKQGAGLSSEGHQPLGQCPAADREEVWQALYALHSLYEVSPLLPRTTAHFLAPPLLGLHQVPTLPSLQSTHRVANSSHLLLTNTDTTNRVSTPAQLQTAAVRSTQHNQR